ncbi:MAG: hypothetical protein S4CHLAM102_06540 [Chlamydiia bacterium]|nr:hypothetical protein [Chlamydiia bacterium]
MKGIASGSNMPPTIPPTIPEDYSSAFEENPLDFPLFDHSPDTDFFSANSLEIWFPSPEDLSTIPESDLLPSGSSQTVTTVAESVLGKRSASQEQALAARKNEISQLVANIMSQAREGKLDHMHQSLAHVRKVIGIEKKEEWQEIFAEAWLHLSRYYHTRESESTSYCVDQFLRFRSRRQKVRFDPVIRSYMAIALADDGKTEPAAYQLKRIKAPVPAEAKAALFRAGCLLAQAYLAEGSLSLANQIYKDRLQSVDFPQSDVAKECRSRTLIEFGIAFARAGKQAEANKLYPQRLSEEEQKTYYLKVAQSLVQKGDLDAVLEILTLQKLEAGDELKRLYLNVTKLAMRRNRMGVALRCFNLIQHPMPNGMFRGYTVTRSRILLRQAEGGNIVGCLHFIERAKNTLIERKCAAVLLQQLVILSTKKRAFKDAKRYLNMLPDYTDETSTLAHIVYLSQNP